MDALGPWHLLIIAAFFVILFGAKKLPDAARSLGRSARIMKSELKGLHDDPKMTDPTVTDPPATDAFVRPLEAHLEPTRPTVADEIPVTVRGNGAR